MSDNNKSFDQTIAELSGHEPVLIALYQEYNKRFLSDNGRIWTTAATMVPLSLGAFAVLASIDNPNLAQVITFSLAGWALMSAWLLIAENHRAFQDASLQWTRAIERQWGFEEVPTPKASPSFLVQKVSVRRMRFMLWWFVTAGAIAAVLFLPGGLISR